MRRRRQFWISEPDEDGKCALGWALPGQLVTLGYTTNHRRAWRIVQALHAQEVVG